MKGSLVIVGFFVLGILAGLSGIVPEKIVEGNLTFYALCALLFFVGIGVGSDRNIVSRFKSLDVRMALLPAGTMLGTFAGALAAALILPGRSATDCLAVGSGFGYYSLSSIFITRYRCIVVQHHKGDGHASAGSASCQNRWSARSDSRRWRYIDGHHTSDHHGILRQGIFSALSLPWLRPRILHPVHRHILVHDLTSMQGRSGC